MKEKTYVLRYAEVGLKGKNRSYFEKKLVQNIKKQAEAERIIRAEGRIIVFAKKNIHTKLRRVFGLASFSPATECEPQLKKIAEKAVEIAQKTAKTTTFCVRTQRLDKNHPLNSLQMNQQIGAEISTRTGLKVDLEKPGLCIGIEILNKYAFIFTKTINCFGGLPVGSEGRVALFADKFDDKTLLAGLMMMKRGCYLDIVSSKPIPEIMQQFSPREIQVFSSIKQLTHDKALAVPDTLEELKDYDTELPVLRPVIGLSSLQIKELAEKYKRAARNHS